MLRIPDFTLDSILRCILDLIMALHRDVMPTGSKLQSLAKTSRFEELVSTKKGI